MWGPCAGFAKRLEESMFDMLGRWMKKTYSRQKHTATAAAAREAALGALAKARGRPGESL